MITQGDLKVGRKITNMIRPAVTTNMYMCMHMYEHMRQPLNHQGV